MKKILFIITVLFTLSGCGESFDAAYEVFRTPLNSIPSVSIEPVTGWQTSPIITGSAADSDNDALAYRWSEVTSYGVTFTQTTNPQTVVSFSGNTNGDVAVNAVIRLTVYDGEDESYKDMNLQIYRNDVLFVTPAGTGSGNHPESPLKGGNYGELASAITYAKNSSKTIVALASGTYRIISAVSLTEGVSLYGGYSISDWSRNVKVNESTIKDESLYPTSTNPNGAIKALAGITNATSLNGIAIEIGRGSWAAGIQCSSTSGLTVTNCLIRSRTDGSDKNTAQQFGINLRDCGNIIINGCSIVLGEVENSSGTTWSVGIVLVGTGNVLINGNSIYSGRSITTGTAITYAYGINTNTTNNAALTITNNLISSGISASGTSNGINLVNDTGGGTYRIQNNTICALNPLSNSTSCIRVGTSSGVEIIENNIFIATGSSNSYCLTLAAGCTPDSLKNNLLYIDTIAQFNAFLSVNSVLYKDLVTTIPAFGTTLLSLGNITENIQNYLVNFDGIDNDISTLSDNDWHIIKDINTPMNLIYGGLDLSGDVLYDYDGNPRTNLNYLKATNVGAGGFTIGAFEED